MDSSDFYGFLECRSSVREYDDEQLGTDDVDYILRCASTAPSAGNLEAWDVIVVREEETRAALAEAAFSQKHVEQAPVVFVPCRGTGNAVSCTALRTQPLPAHT